MKKGSKGGGGTPARQIRTLALNKTNIPPELIGDYFVRELPASGGVFTYRRKALACGPGSLVLFQYDAAIRAYAILDHIEDDVVVDEDGVPWPGAYVFVPQTIRFLGSPVRLEELRGVAGNIHVFGQASHTIDIGLWDDVMSLLRAHE